MFVVRMIHGLRSARGIKKHEYGIEIINGGKKPFWKNYSAGDKLAVGHKEFKSVEY